MNEILKLVIKLKKGVQNIQRKIKSPMERNGFGQFWIALYIVHEMLSITNKTIDAHI